MDDNIFNADWTIAESEALVCYNVDPDFESSFKNLGINWNYDINWCFAEALGTSNYKLDTQLEQEFLIVLSWIGVLNIDEFDECWDIIGRTLSDDNFEDNKMFEDCFDEYSYDLLFESFSKSNVEFQNSVEFENHFKAIVLKAESGQDAYVDKAKGVQRNKKNCLKSLLTERLKRQKQMAEYMKTVKSDSGQVEYQCKVCGHLSVWQRKLFFSHIIPLHIKSTVKPPKKKKPNLRNQSRKLASNIKRKYICERLECSATFSSRRNRKRHMASVHNDNLRIKCQVCGRCFRDKLDLERHTRGVHKKISVYRCAICLYKTKIRCNLRRHEKSKHGVATFGQDGSIVCDLCNETFSKVYLMKQHTLAHLAIQIGFECCFCGIVKQENHTCVFSCSKCDRTFPNKAILSKHLKLHSKLEEFSQDLSQIGHHEELNAQIANLKF